MKVTVGNRQFHQLSPKRRIVGVIAIFRQQNDIRLAFHGWYLRLPSVARAANQPHSKFDHVYPIVRIGAPVDLAYPTNSVTVVKVLTSQGDAELEVTRLSQLNADKSCVYFYCISRLIG
jgi:hypothetical protein